MSQRDLFMPDATELGRQASAVLEHLRRGNGLTSTEALDLYGIARLAAVVHDLRGAGYRIRTERVQVERVHGEGKATVARYWMERGA